MIRLAGALLSEQNDEWLVQRRYLSVESMALILAEPADPEPPQADRRCPVSRPPETPPGAYPTDQLPSSVPRIPPGPSMAGGRHNLTQTPQLRHKHRKGGEPTNPAQDAEPDELTPPLHHEKRLDSPLTGPSVVADQAPVNEQAGLASLQPDPPPIKALGAPQSLVLLRSPALQVGADTL